MLPAMDTISLPHFPEGIDTRLPGTTPPPQPPLNAQRSDDDGDDPPVNWLRPLLIESAILTLFVLGYLASVWWPHFHTA